MSAPPAKKAGMGLYADLLGGDQNATPSISGAPVRYNLKRPEEDAGAAAIAAQKKKDASLMFQPMKRPQVQPKKLRNPNPSSSSSATAHKLTSSIASATASSPDKPAPSSVQPPPQFQSSNFEDWIGDEDEDFGYQDRQREQRKNKKKNRKQPQTRRWEWDDIYDPARPNQYADYKRSEEEIREIRDWKARLYYHHLKEVKKEERKSVGSSDEGDGQRRPVNPMFAPPSSLNFAPPNFGDDDRLNTHTMHGGRSPSPLIREIEDSLPDPTGLAGGNVANDMTGEDAYERRLGMDNPASAIPPSLTPAQAFQTAMTPAAPMISTTEQSPEDNKAKVAVAMARIAAFKAKLSAPPATVLDEVIPDPPPPLPVFSTDRASSTGTVSRQTTLGIPPPPPLPSSPPPKPSGSTIARAPVRYEVPPPPPDQTSTIADNAPGSDVLEGSISSSAGDMVDENAPRSTRPGQKGFAERMLKKYGWEKGQGLGAQGDGITTAIVAKADKRKKRSDAEGGGYVTPANMGRIVGGKRRKVEGGGVDGSDGVDGNGSGPNYAATSEVVKLEGLLAGLDDVAHEMENGDLLQRLGDQLGAAYGNVERLFVWRPTAGGHDEVFVKFTSALSALRAVNAPAGVQFAGAIASARFFDVERFERGDYD